MRWENLRRDLFLILTQSFFCYLSASNIEKFNENDLEIMNAFNIFHWCGFNDWHAEGFISTCALTSMLFCGLLEGIDHLRNGNPADIPTELPEEDPKPGLN